MARRRAGKEVPGLPGLRRAGAITELLFLYEVVTRESTQLQPIAERLGLTVQAVSHVFRQAERAGLVEHRDGRYRVTIEGVARLHESLGSLREDLDERWDRLNTVRTGRAVAAHGLREGDQVALTVRDGELTASRGAGPATGRALGAARSGELVDVGELSGIVPVPAGKIVVFTFRDADARSAAAEGEVRQLVDGRPGTLLGAFGLEASVLLRRATDRPFVRFGVIPAAIEATQLGVDAAIFVRDTDVPRLMRQLDRSPTPPLETRPLPRRGGRT